MAPVLDPPHRVTAGRSTPSDRDSPSVKAIGSCERSRRLRLKVQQKASKDSVDNVAPGVTLEGQSLPVRQNNSLFLSGSHAVMGAHTESRAGKTPDFLNKKAGPTTSASLSRENITQRTGMGEVGAQRVS